jgi:transcriptional regulator with XRE-family HTH domain
MRCLEPPLNPCSEMALRVLREERGYSQEELAERAGLHRNYVGGVEREEPNVALENIVSWPERFLSEPRIYSTLFPKAPTLEFPLRERAPKL